MMPNRVKVRRMDGGYWYQPPSLKTISSLFLDKTSRQQAPNLQLYQLVQKVVDRLVDWVEDRLLGLKNIGYKSGVVNFVHLVP